MSGRTLAGLALADFRERTRRPGYLLTLAAAVVLGYLALPPATSHWVIMNAGGYRGIDNSAYAATATALAGGLWLMLGGFYVVRDAVIRDERTRVGQILAATPLTRVGYLAGKFCSNLLVLGSMLGVLPATALALQLIRGESRVVDPGALFLPFVLLTLPVLAVTAAAAVVCETVPGLRGGLGNIVWFFAWMTCAIAGGGAPLGGMGAVVASMRQAMARQHLPAAAEFSVGFTEVEHPLRSFDWSGLHPSAGFAIGRLVFVLVAVCGAVLPALWFGRFDTARVAGRPAATSPIGGTPPDEWSATGAGLPPSPPRALAYRPLSSVGARSRLALRRLWLGELRILLRGLSRWWWLAVAALNAASLAVPADLAGARGTATAVLLSAAWVWPVLIWSRLGTQRRENGLDTLLGAHPGVYRQLAAEWAAGVTLAVVTGFGPLIRMAAAADGPRVAAWVAGAAFIPSLALLLGTATRTHRAFQLGYIILWYAMVNQVAAADYAGTVLVNGHPAGPPPALVGGVAFAMLCIAVVVRAVRHATR
jgi:hypothetical protein